MGESQKRDRLISFCVGCGHQIQDRFLLRVFPDLEWHVGCLKCAECSRYLDESCTCFIKDGKTLCKEDYRRLYGVKCAKCFIAFTRNDYVMRTYKNVYHVQCFRCEACNRQLIPGDEFTVRQGYLYCTADHDVSAGTLTYIKGPVHHTHQDKSVTIPAAQKRPERTTRIRTVLSETQLHMLRTCYNANPRPDALMKEQLVEMTGLSPRVIRVWFQNKRCKDKKRIILMRQTQRQPSDQTVKEEPLLTASPEITDSDFLISPLNIQSYTPSWKLISNFPMHSDCRHSSYKQLITLSEDGSGSNSTGSEVVSLSSQLPDTPNSLTGSPTEVAN